MVVVELLSLLSTPTTVNTKSKGCGLVVDLVARRCWHQEINRVVVILLQWLLLASGD